MDITLAQYIQDEDNVNTTIKATIEGTVLFVPLDPGNRHYAEMMRQVADGDLTITDAD